MKPPITTRRAALKSFLLGIGAMLFGKRDTSAMELVQLKPFSWGGSTMPESAKPKCAFCFRPMNGIRPWAYKSRNVGPSWTHVGLTYYCSENCAVKAQPARYTICVDPASGENGDAPDSSAMAIYRYRLEDGRWHFVSKIDLTPTEEQKRLSLELSKWFATRTK